MAKKRMTPTARIVLNLLQVRSNSNNECVISMRALARQSDNLKKGDIARGIRRLLELNRVERELRLSDPGVQGRWGPSLYRILPDTPVGETATAAEAENKDTPPVASPGENDPSSLASSNDGDPPPPPDGDPPPPPDGGPSDPLQGSPNDNDGLSRLWRSEEKILQHARQLAYAGEKELILDKYSIANEISMPAATAYASMARLAARGFLERLEEKGRYGLARYRVLPAALIMPNNAPEQPDAPKAPDATNRLLEKVETLVSNSDNLLGRMQRIEDQMQRIEDQISHKIRTRAEAMLEEAQTLLHKNALGPQLACVIAHAVAASQLACHEFPTLSVSDQATTTWERLRRLQHIATRTPRTVSTSLGADALAMARQIIYSKEDALSG